MLYKVTFDQLTLISTFDSKGKKIGEREERVPISLHDLPYRTACMYRDKAKNLNFRMEKQGASDSEPKRRAYKDDRRDRPSFKGRPREDAITRAAKSGDLAAAISER
jgi:hypothetical protein